MANESPKIEITKGNVDESSSANQRIVFSSLFLQLFWLLNIAAVTHIQIFEPGSTLKLPIFGVDLSLYGFALLTPFILLAVHFYELYNLSRHSKKLYAWAETMPEIEHSDKFPLIVHPFIFNNIRYDGKRTHEVLIQLFVFAIVFLLPIILSIYHFIVFSPFHSLGLTLANMMAILLEALIIFVYHHRIIFPEKYLEKSPSDLARLGRKLAFNPISLILKGIIQGIFRLFKPSKQASAKGAKAKTKTSKKKESSLHFSRQVVYHFVEYCTYLGVGFALFLSIKVIQISTGNPFGKGNLVSLDLSERSLLRVRPDLGELYPLFFYPKDSLNKWQRYQNTLPLYPLDRFKGFNCSGRNMSMGNFSESELVRWKFRGGRAQKANFTKAILQGADLRKSDFSGASFQGALLSEAQLSGCNFYNTDFSQVEKYSYRAEKEPLQTQMFFVDADSCDFSKANMHLIQMQEGHYLANSLFFETVLTLADINRMPMDHLSFVNTILDKGRISYSDIRNVLFLNTSLRSVDLTGSAFSNCSFSGSCLKGTSLKTYMLDTDFSFTQMFSLNFGESSFGNCDFREANLRNTSWEGALVEDCNFYNADLSGADLRGAVIRNCTFEKADLRGASYDAALDSILRVQGAILEGDPPTESSAGYRKCPDSGLVG